jgi:hypothetical protein
MTICVTSNFHQLTLKPVDIIITQLSKPLFHEDRSILNSLYYIKLTIS